MQQAQSLQRVTRRYPCPICGRPDWCGLGHDFAVCMRIESDIPTANGGWLHRLGDRRPAMPVLPEEIPCAPLHVRHSVYTNLLLHLPLLPIHYQQLQNRGFTAEAIQRRGYASLPPEQQTGTYSRASIAYAAGHLSDQRLDGVPGFAIEQGPKGQRWTVAGTGGLLVPVRNAEGRVAGCQVRVDDTTVGRKYRWLSSRDMDCGTPSGAYLHVARPPKQTTEQIWITEGPLKADRASESLGAIVLAMPGVSTWREVPQVIRALGARQVILAYDQDILTNQQVKLHAQQLLEALQALQLPVPDRDALAPPRVYWARWNGGAKGIDDALQMGMKIELRRQ